MRNPLLIIIAVLSLSGFIESAAAQHYTFQRYGQSDGLGNLATRCMMQDSNGFLWVCTEDGLFRFDGSLFEKMPIDSRDGPYITGMTQDGAGRIWVATNHTLLYYDATGQHVVNAPGEELEFDLHASLATDPEDTGRFYFVSRHTLFVAHRDTKGDWRVTRYFGAQDVARHPELKTISFVYAAQYGRLWLGCGSGLCSVLNKTIHSYVRGDGLPEEEWRMVFIDRLKRVWVRGERNLYRFDPSQQNFVAADIGVPANSISVRDPAITEDRQGRILINLTDGIARLDGSSWQVFNEKTDLPPYPVTSLFVDRQGSVWLGLGGHGLARWLGYDEVESFTTANGLSTDVVWNFSRDRQSRLWIGTERNLEMMSQNKITSQLDAKGKPIRRVQALALTDDGHIWSGSDNGIVLDYDPNTKRTREVARLRGVFQIFSDRSGGVWICSMSGLYHVETRDQKRTLLQLATSMGPHGQVYEATQGQDGTLWFISDSGLFRLSGDAWSHIQMPPDYLPNLSAQIAIAQDGTLWVSGSDPVMMHLRVQGESAKELDRVGAATLGSSSVYFLKVDRRGWLWVGTAEGLRISNGQRWTRFTSEDGLIWNDTNSNAFYEDTNGTVWIGTSGGMSHLFHPERFFQTESPSITARDAKIGNTALNLDADTKVPWGRQPLTARFSSFDFKHESSTNFRYRVEGVGEDWQETAKHELRYPPLPPGRYRLAVIAFDAFDGRHSAPVYVSFEILPPWWRTGGILAGEVVTVLLLCFLLWRWSVRVLVARQHHLEGLVRERTRELEAEKAELLKARADLEEQAVHDSLTGLLNRGAILNHLESQMGRAGREGSCLALVLLDVDHFKQVNDTFGHLTGDCVLREYAKRLRSIARRYDTMGRYGGEEFLLILPGFPTVDSEGRLAAIHDSLCHDHYFCNGHELVVTCSLGVSWYQPGLDSAQSLIERADQALYAAKARGRNRVEVG